MVGDIADPFNMSIERTIVCNQSDHQRDCISRLIGEKGMRAGSAQYLVNAAESRALRARAVLATFCPSNGPQEAAKFSYYAISGMKPESSRNHEIST